MQIRYALAALTFLAFGAGCASSTTEPPASEATEGTELPAQPAETLQPAPAAVDSTTPVAPTASPATPAAAITQPPAPAMPPHAAVVIHTVKDYDAWKTAFDGHEAARKEASIAGSGVMRGVDDPNTVAVYLPANDLAKLQAFLSDKALKDTMKEAGVKGKPTIYTMKDAGGKMADKATHGAILQVKIKAFDAFKTAIDSQQDARIAAGVTGYSIGQDTEKGEEVAYLYLQSDDVAKLKAYLDAKETKQAFKDAGVRGQPKTLIAQEGEMKMYQ